MVIISYSTKKNWERVLNKTFSNSLKIRANKTFSKKHILPSELIDKDFLNYCLSLKNEGYALNDILYTISRYYIDGVKNKYIDQIILEYNTNNFLEDKFDNYRSFIKSSNDDLLGAVYQYLLNEGERNTKGLYYTPKEIIYSQVRGYDFIGKKILDPACGSGNYLLSLNVDNPKLLYGFDRDNFAVIIAKLNLIKKYRYIEFEPNIFCLDFIYDDLNSFGKFDFIVSNPPWGNKEVKFNKPLNYTITSGESFSYFIEKALKLLNDNGTLSYLLPVSILNVNLHKDIRNIILKNKIEKVLEVGRPFKGVFTNVIILNLRKTKPSGNYSFLLNSKEVNIDKVFDKRLKIFSINNIVGDNKIIDIMDNLKNATYLNDHNAIFGLGIVTGNNKEYITKVKGKDNVKIYRGKHIKKYYIDNTDEYIRFIPNKFQQITDIWKYKYKPKLIYRFISKNLIFAYDNEGIFTLNSANFIITKLEYDIRVILAFFNSSVYNEYFQKKFNSIKVLKSHIQSLPLLLKHAFDKKIIYLVDDILSGNKDSVEKLDSYIYNIITK